MNASEKKKKNSGRRLLSVFLAVLICSTVSSMYALDSSGSILGTDEQQQTVKKVEGTVTDSQGEPLIGVSIVIKGTGKGTVTDIDGKYVLDLSSATGPVSLVFTYVGQKSQTLLVNKPVMDVIMIDTSNMMDEVVIVGYGQQKKVNLTGAISAVDVEKTFGSRPIADVGRGLQGAAAGLSVVLPSGEIGTDPIIKIRGQLSSPNSTGSPLILVDNVEVPSIQAINPDDVENISILKDAASASIYGAKAANGVVLITLKKGAKTETIDVTYTGNFAWQNVAKKLEMGGIEGLEYTLDAQDNRGTPMPAGGFWRVDRASLEKVKEWQAKYGGIVKPTDPVVYNRDWVYDPAGNNKMGYRLYDPYEIMVRKWAPTETHNLSAIGRTGKTAYNIGLAYIHQNGMMKPTAHDDFRRYNASLNITSEVNKFLTIRAAAMYSDRMKRYPEAPDSGADPWLYVYRWSRLFPIGVEENGKPLRNPAYQTMTTNTNSVQNIYSTVSLGATVNFTKNWDMQFDYTYSNQQDIEKKGRPGFTAGDVWYTPELWKNADGSQVYVDNEGNVTNGFGSQAYRFQQTEYYGLETTYVSRNSNVSNKNTFNAYSTYKLKLGDENKHDFKFMVGMNQVSDDNESHYAKKTQLIDYDNIEFGYATGEQFASGKKAWSSQLGFFGRVNYILKNKYLLEANLRYDGLSKFPKHLRWKWFPSFSGGWVISEESFMKPVQSVVSFAKVRASWGSIGDPYVTDYLYIATMPYMESTWLGSDGKKFPGFKTPTAVQKNITWQENVTTDIGLDMRFFKNKLGLTLDWFQRETKNMLVGGLDLPSSFGTGAPIGNYGNMRVSGWEITADYSHRFANGLGINIMGTLSDATGKVTKGPDHLDDEKDRKLDATLRTGRRMGDIYGYTTDRLYQKDDFEHNADGSIKKTTIIINGVAKETHMLSGSNPVYQTFLEDGGQVLIFSPGDVKYVDVNGDGYITDGDRTVGNPGDRTVIGNTTPRYEYGLRLGADYKGVDFSIFFQGVGSRKIWGDGQLAIAGYSAKEGAIPTAIATDYWREDRTDAFYPRAWDLGGSNTGYSMQVQSKYLLNMAYLRIKNITVGYSLPPELLRKAYLKKARLFVSLENFLTFDKLRGLPIDPEVISGKGAFSDSYNLGRTGAGTPVFKTASVGVQIGF